MHTLPMMIAQALACVLAVYATRYVKTLLSNKPKVEDPQ